MTSKSHNAKKPKLAHHSPDPAILAGTLAAEGSAPGNHKMSFAQHKHELEVGQKATALPRIVSPAPRNKSDMQQRQQKPNSRS
jgi:hypothetical protein